MLTFMNYISSNEFNDKPEEISNDNTFWSWCKWGMAMVNREALNEITSEDLKMVRRNGEISKSAMSKYIEIIGRKRLASRIVIHNVTQVGKRYDNSCHEKLKLHDLTFIPFLLTNELNGTNHWILVEIDMKEKKITTYNPENLNGSATRNLVNVFTELDQHEGEWKYEVSTSTTAQERKNDSGVFVSAWIESIVLNGSVINSIKSSMVFLYREKMYKALMLKDKKDINNTREVKQNLEKVLRFRNEILQDEEYLGTCALPVNVLAKQTEDLTQITKIEVHRSYLSSTCNAPNPFFLN